MKSRVLYKHIFVFLFLSIFVRKSIELPILETRPVVKSEENRPRVPNPGPVSKPQEDIFEIILSANSARRKLSSALKMMEAGGETERLFQGDIVMTNDIETALKNSHTDTMTLPKRGKKGGRRQRRAVTARVKDKWPVVNGQVEVPYVIEASSVPNKTSIIQAINHWQSKVPCIAFVPRTNQPDYLSFFSGQGCFSWIGRIGGKQRISIGPGCLDMGVIAHEIGHALGFWHEQSRPDRDQFVKILWNNIRSDKVSDFLKISNTDSNDLGVPYDLSSLMHYGPKAFTTSPNLNTIESLNGSTNFGQRNGLSEKDIEQARLLYCPGTSVCQSLYTDLNRGCSSWSDLGHCDSVNYTDFMKINCKKSCICRICEDKNPGCSSYVASGYCTSHKAYTRINCRKSCGLCK